MTQFSDDIKALREALARGPGWPVRLILKDLPEREKATLLFQNEAHPDRISRLITCLEELKEALTWYANWDWSDKYVQAVPKRARAVLEKWVLG